MKLPAEACNAQKHSEETMVYIGLRVRIPFRVWDDPDGAKFRQDKFELHRIMTSSVGPAAKGDKGSGEAKGKGKIGSGTMQQSPGCDPDPGEPSTAAQESTTNLLSKGTTLEPNNSSTYELQNLSLGTEATKPWSNLEDSSSTK